MGIDKKTREEINEADLRQYLSAWDPTWRWTLLLGLRDLRQNAARLGDLASQETGSEEWRDDRYVFGPIVLGLTASAVNELALHCEDLFALLKFAADRDRFVQRMVSYSAGQVVTFGKRLATRSDDEIRRAFFVPSETLVSQGLADADDPSGAREIAEAGVERLAEFTREVVDWYETYETFHLQYKHGLKIPLRPFGTVTDEAVTDRKRSLTAPLFAFTNEPLTAMPKRPESQQAVMIPLNEAARPYITQLAEERSLLYYLPAGPEVDLNAVVDLAAVISQLMRLAIHNRVELTAGPDGHGLQTFKLPLARGRGTIDVALQPAAAITLDTFA